MAQIEIYTRKLCGFCTAAKRLLEQKGAAFSEYDATFDPAVKSEMIDRAGGARTFPQIFIGDLHVGGCNELLALERQGRLDSLLAESGVS